MTLKQRAEHIYQRMTSYANYSEMNGISRKWMVDKIEEGLEDYRKSKKITWSDVSMETKLGLLAITVANIVMIIIRYAYSS